MARYLLKRLSLMVPLLIAVTLVNFFLYNIAPGDPASVMINERIMRGSLKNMTTEQIDKLLASQRQMMGLDKPWPERYVIWLGSVATGNLGKSLTWGMTVNQVIGPHIWPTVEINIIGIVVTLILGVSLGVLQAVKKYSLFDYTAAFFSFFYVSMPGFFVAILLIFIFAVHLHWLPTGGYATAGIPPSLADHLRHLFLPAATLSLSGVPYMMRITRTAMLEVMGTDYVRTARAKGLAGHVVLIGHALRNCLIPVITELGGMVMWLFSGSIIVETVFAWPGMGQLFIRVVSERDYPSIMGEVLISSTLSVVVILLTDIAYTLVDPRVRLEKAGL